MTSVSTATEASKMLEAALEQMDGIISIAHHTTPNANGSGISSTTQITSTGTIMQGLNERNLISSANVLSTAKTLALALQQVGVSAPAPDANTAAIISDWIETHVPRQDADERLRRLQRDKESLAVQYQVLADRVSVQADKIIELEGLLAEKTQQLSTKDEQLQRQLLSRSALETQKLELMSALSELKLHRAALERENVEMQLENCRSASPINRQRLPYGSVGNLNHGSNAGGTNFTPKTPPAALRHHIQPQFHSLPRTHGSKNNSNNNNNNNNNKSLRNNNHQRFDGNANSPLGATATKQRNVAFASHEKILIDDTDMPTGGDELMNESFVSSLTNSTPSPNLRERSTKGIRSILGKLRRSNSGTFEFPALEQAEPEFRRGGARATAAGRIEWTTQSSQLSASSKSYADWEPQEVCNWLTDLGLGCYENDCKKWLKANPSICFFTASPVDIERELNLKSPLHRKKIKLAIDELTGKEDDELALKAAQLDVGWVMRWLDDIGLPQYKETFLQVKVDGRMLHRLTMEDLAYLRVYSCLHIASLRRGIQCMREMQWDPECLIRRSTKQSTANDAEASNEETEESIALWTAHRVMEWLRVVDLSEYAPNLRGAGVHGALMIYEPRFNANLLADLLSIPPAKTLLRRHLATHFKELIGRDIIQNKRDAEAQPGYQPLTIAGKIKPVKKTQFSLRRRKSSKGTSNEVEWTSYVCPMSNQEDEELKQQQQQNNSANSSSTSTNISS